MKVKIKESKINGIINIPASKSVAHRFLFVLLLQTEKLIFSDVFWRDVEATINAFEN